MGSAKSDKLAIDAIVSCYVSDENAFFKNIFHATCMAINYTRNVM
jgi:hypothetical protein